MNANTINKPTEDEQVLIESCIALTEIAADMEDTIKEQHRIIEMQNELLETQRELIKRDNALISVLLAVTPLCEGKDELVEIIDSLSEVF